MKIPPFTPSLSSTYMDLGVRQGKKSGVGVLMVRGLSSCFIASTMEVMWKLDEACYSHSPVQG